MAKPSLTHITLPGNPSNALEAVPKQYVDTRVVGKSLATPTVTEDGLFIKWDNTLGTFVYAAAAGGSGSPGGSSGQLQYNSAGNFAGNANLTYVPGTGLTLGTDPMLINGTGTPATLSNFRLRGHDTVNGFVQAVLQNLSNGVTASTDFIAMTDTGSDTAEYIDMGINGSGWTGAAWGGPKDGYLYVDGGASGVGDLCIGTGQANTFVDFMVGGGQAANRVLRLDNRGMILTSATSDPSATAAGFLELYAKTIGGRVMPKWIGPSGVDTPIQPFMGMNQMRILTVGTAAAATTVFDGYGGFAWTASATTYAQTTPTTGSLKSRTRLSTLTSAATAGAIAYVKGNTLEVSRETGFFLVMRFGLDTLQAGNLGFFGLRGSVTALTATTNQVTSTTAHVGMAIQANSGNWQLVTASGSAVTATDLGASFPVNTTDLLELVLFSAPGGSVISYRVTNMTTGATTSGDLSGNLPGATAFMTPHEALSNNATAAAVKFSHKIMYLETDY